jgi:hypothetical protein
MAGGPAAGRRGSAAAGSARRRDRSYDEDHAQPEPPATPSDVDNWVSATRPAAGGGVMWPSAPASVSTAGAPSPSPSGYGGGAVQWGAASNSNNHNNNALSNSGAVGVRDTDPSSYRARRRRQKFHDPRRGAARIHAPGSQAPAAGFQERRSDFDRNRSGWSAVQAKETIFPPEGAVGAIGEVAPKAIVSVYDLDEDDRAAMGSDYRRNLEQARATRAKQVIFSQAETSGHHLRLSRTGDRGDAATPVGAVHRVTTPQTRSIPKVFRSGPVDQSAGLAGLQVNRVAYATNKDASQASRVRDIIAPPGSIGGVNAVPVRLDAVAVNGRRDRQRGGRESPATRSVPNSLRDPGARFSRREVVHNAREAHDIAQVNKQFGTLSEIPSVFAHWQEVSDSARAARGAAAGGDPDRDTPLNSRVHAQTPTSRSVPRSLRVAAASTEERARGFREARDERNGNRNRVHNTTIANVFHYEKGRAGAADVRVANNVADSAATSGMPVPDERLARRGREDARKSYLENRGRTFKRDINLFEWSGAESSASEDELVF